MIDIDVQHPTPALNFFTELYSRGHIQCGVALAQVSGHETKRASILIL